jgi:hypothetical protein
MGLFRPVAGQHYFTLLSSLAQYTMLVRYNCEVLSSTLGKDARHPEISNACSAFIIIIIGTTAHSEPRPPFEASASCHCSLQHSSNFSPPASWHLPSRRPSILVLVYPFDFFLLLLQRGLFLQGSVPPVE